MGRYSCCVPMCRNYLGNGKRLSYHSFPVCDNRREEWVEKIWKSKEEYKISKHTKVCSAHFIESDWRPILRTKRKLLKKNAVPSIFSWTITTNASNAKTKAPTEAPKKTRKKRKPVVESEPVHAPASSDHETKDTPEVKRQQEEPASDKDDEGDAIVEELGPLSMCEIVHESGEGGSFAPEIVSVYSLENHMRTYSRTSPAEPQRTRYYQEEIFKVEEKKKEGLKVYPGKIVQRLKLEPVSEIPDVSAEDALEDGREEISKSEDLKVNSGRVVQRTKAEALSQVPDTVLIGSLQNFPRDNWFVKCKARILTAICVEDRVVQKCLTVRLVSGYYCVAVLGNPITEEVFKELKVIPLIQNLEDLKLVMSSLQAYKICAGSGEMDYFNDYMAGPVKNFKPCRLTNTIRCETCHYLVSRTLRCVPCATQRIMLTRRRDVAKESGT